ncbi:MAG: hypothetical protein WCG98_01495 [bacterium]
MPKTKKQILADTEVIPEGQKVYHTSSEMKEIFAGTFGMSKEEIKP